MEAVPTKKTVVRRWRKKKRTSLRTQSREGGEKIKAASRGNADKEDGSESSYLAHKGRKMS